MTKDEFFSIIRSEWISGSGDWNHNGAGRVEAAVKENTEVLKQLIGLLSDEPVDEPPVANRGLDDALDAAAPDCAEPSRHNV